MIYLIHGNDNFRSFLKLQEIKQKYQTYNSFTFDCANKEQPFDYSDIKSAFETINLFDQSKIIILKNFYAKKYPDLKDLLQWIQKENDSSCLVIFYEEKELSEKQWPKHIKWEEYKFNALQGKELIKWIKELEKQFSAILDPEVEALLADSFENNSGAVYNEILKLSLLHKKITLNDLADITSLPANPKAFALTNAIVNQNTKEALRVLYEEYNNGSNLNLLFGSITAQIRLLLITKTADKEQLQKLFAGKKPFYKQKIIKLSQSFSQSELKRLMLKLFSLDTQIKKGKIEPLFALETFISQMPV